MKKLFLIGTAFFFFIGACKNKWPDKIRVENKLGKKIICVFAYNYPDTDLSFTNKGYLLADTGFCQLDSSQIKELDTLGLCKKDNWDKYVKQSLLMLIVFDKKKLLHVKDINDAVLERYYFSYAKLIEDKGLIVVY